jgi:hypothetical protein
MASATRIPSEDGTFKEGGAANVHVAHGRLRELGKGVHEGLGLDRNLANC